MKKKSFLVRYWIRVSVATGVVVLLAMPLAHADEPPSSSDGDGTLSEIIVTATKRAEPLSKVPISVDAFSQQEMDEKGVRSMSDIAKFTPGVNFVTSGPREGTDIAIRGIDSRVGSATTGVYIDDTSIQVRSVGLFVGNTYPQVFDLERVEILRGPQGTLYGAGSEGGTVRFITPQPDLHDTSLYARGEWNLPEGGGPGGEFGAAAGGPLIEGKLGVRASVWRQYRGGWIDRVDRFSGAVVTPNNNWQRTLSTRVALTAEPVESLKITPSFYYQRISDNADDRSWSTLSDSSAGVYREGNPLGEPGYDRFSLASLRIEYTTGPVQITSNSSLFTRDARYKFDFSTADPAEISAAIFPPEALVYNGFPDFTGYTDQDDRQRNITSELRISPAERHGRFNWLFGLFFEHLKQDSFEGISGLNTPTMNADLGLPPFLFLPNVQPGDYGFVAQSRAIDKQFAGFGELGYNLTPTLQAIAGFRVAHTVVDFRNHTAGPFAGPTPDAANTNSQTVSTPKYGLSWQVTDNQLYYLSAAKGFRPAGGNSGIPTAFCGAALAQIGLTQAPATYNPDSLWSYEVGGKERLFGGKLQLNTSAFYIRWKNIQQRMFLPCNFQYTANAGTAVSKGFDLSVRYAPTKHLTLAAGVGYTDAYYTETAYPGANHGTGPLSVLVTNGDTLGTAPWNLTGSARYTIDLSNKTVAYLTIDDNYASHNSGRSPVQDPASVAYNSGYPELPSVNTLNVRLGVIAGRLDVSLFAKNLLNADPVVFYFHETPLDPLFKNSRLPPRLVGLTATFSM